MWSFLTKGLECLHNKHSQVCLPQDIKMRLKTKQVLKLLKKIQLKFKCKMKKRNKMQICDMTHDYWIYFEENYVQKIKKTRKQVKKMMVKHATMGMRAHILSQFFPHSVILSQLLVHFFIHCTLVNFQADFFML